MNEQQLELLKEICANKISEAAFSGMIFNNQLKTPGLSSEHLIEVALNIRLKMREMIK